MGRVILQTGITVVLGVLCDQVRVEVDYGRDNKDYTASGNELGRVAIATLGGSRPSNFFA